MIHNVEQMRDGKFVGGALIVLIGARWYNFPPPTAFRRKQLQAAGTQHVTPAMASYSAALPSVARSLFAPCRLPLRQVPAMPAFTGFQQTRGMKNKSKDKGKKTKSKADRRGAKEFQQKDLKDMEQFALCDAMR